MLNKIIPTQDARSSIEINMHRLNYNATLDPRLVQEMNELFCDDRFFSVLSENGFQLNRKRAAVDGLDFCGDRNTFGIQLEVGLKEPFKVDYDTFCDIKYPKFVMLKKMLRALCNTFFIENGYDLSLGPRMFILQLYDIAETRPKYDADVLVKIFNIYIGLKNDVDDLLNYYGKTPDIFDEGRQDDEEP